jgi:hypothetical protein
MKYKMFFGIIPTVIMSLVVAACTAIFILDILMLTLPELATSQPAVAGVSLAICVIVAFASLMLMLFSSYKIDGDNLKLALGFFKDKIDSGKVEAIMKNTVNGELTLIIPGNAEKGELPLNVKLFLNDKHTEEFIMVMRCKNPAIVVEDFTPEPKEKKSK